MADKNGIATLFESTGQELSEDFKSKVQTIFEASVDAKVAELREEIEAEHAEKMDEQAQEAIASMELKVDEYLTYVAEQWMENNELAVEKGIAHEISESFLKGMKSLFEDHYVDLPEDKVDVVAEMAEDIEKLENAMNEAINKSIDAETALAGMKKQLAIMEMSNGMADSEIDTLNDLLESVDFEDDDSFRGKAQTIIESYFPNHITEGCDDGDDDDDDDDGDKKKKKFPFDKKKKKKGNDDGDEETNESMNLYVASISKNSKF